MTTTTTTTTQQVAVYSYEDDSREEIFRGLEHEARRAAAKELGLKSLRGLAQAPSLDGGILFFAPGYASDDESTPSVELVWF